MVQLLLEVVGTRGADATGRGGVIPLGAIGVRGYTGREIQLRGEHEPPGETRLTPRQHPSATIELVGES